MISNFVEIREDGKIITEDMSEEDIWQLGDICKVVKITWEYGGNSQYIENAYGILSSLLPDKTGILYIATGGELVCVNADGTTRFNKYAFNYTGSRDSLFAWFEINESEVGVVLQSDNGNTLVKFEPSSGKTISKQKCW